MTDQIIVKSIGLDKVRKALKGLEEKGQEHTARALKKIGFKIELAAKEATPVKTGRLRASVSTNWSGSGMSEGKMGSKAQKGDGMPQPPSKKGLTVVTGSNVKYARRIEHGFVGTDSLGRQYNQSGKPYLYPAFFMHEGEIEKELKKEFSKK